MLSHTLVIFGGGSTSRRVMCLQVCYLVRLECPLFACTSLVKVAAGRARTCHLIFFDRHAGGIICGGLSSADRLALLKHGASHRLLGLLAGGRRVDHLVRLQEELVHSGRAVVDRHASAQAVDIVSTHWHLVGIYELIDLFICELELAYPSSCIGPG